MKHGVLKIYKRQKLPSALPRPSLAICPVFNSLEVFVCEKLNERRARFRTFQTSLRS